MIVLLLAFMIIVIGCTDEKEKDESKVMLEDVVQAIRAEGPELIPWKHTSESYVLNNVHPSAFTIGNALENVAHPEAIYVYIFDSEKAVKEAKSKVSGKFIVTTKTAIEYYKQKNALVVYLANGGKIDKFGNKIQTAMQKL